MMKSILLITLFSVLLVLSSPVFGVMVQVPLDKLVSRAPIIVEAEVLRSHAYWNSDGTMIYTNVLITVFEQIKGHSVPTVLIVRLAGGQVGDIVCRVSDTPVFELGERILLFLKPIPGALLLDKVVMGPQLFEVVDRAQGKFTIKDDLALRSGYTLFPDLKEASFQFPYSQLKNMIASLVEMESGR